jgi:hypothetical protein
MLVGQCLCVRACRNRHSRTVQASLDACQQQHQDDLESRLAEVKAEQTNQNSRARAGQERTIAALSKQLDDLQRQLTDRV